MLRLLLESAGFVVVGEVGTGAAVLAAVQQTEPDLVLLDVLLPDLSGLVVAERIADLDSAPSVVLVSSRLRSELAPALARARVLGFLQKDELTVERLVDLVE